MRLFTFLRQNALIFAGLIFISNTTFAQESPASRSDILAQPKFKAAEFMLAGNMQDGCAVLEQSYDLQNTNDTDVLYMRGQCLQGLGRHGEAIDAYERILAINPDAGSVRMHLANAYRQAGNMSQARGELKEVLRLGPTEKVAANIRKALALTEQQKQWFAEVEGGLIYDSNISAGPDNDQITIFGLPFTLDAASQEEDSLGYNFSAAGGYRIPISPNLGVVAQGSYNQTDYVESDTFDSKSISVSAGPVYKIGMLTLNANLTGAWRALDGDTYSRSIGLNTGATYRINDKTALNATAGAVKQNYVSDSRDGNNLYLNTGINYKPTENVVLQAGYSVGSDDAEDERYENVRHGPNVGATMKMSKNMIGRLNLSFNHADYKGQDAAFGNEARDDEIYSANARLSYDLDEHLNTDGVSVNFDVGYVRSDSNIQIYDYERHTAIISITKAW